MDRIVLITVGRWSDPTSASTSVSVPVASDRETRVVSGRVSCPVREMKVGGWPPPQTCPPDSVLEPRLCVGLVA